MTTEHPLFWAARMGSIARFAGLAAFCLFATFAFFAAPSAAAEARGHAGHAASGPVRAEGKAASPYASLAPFRCNDITLKCATAATPAWAPDGALWLAWIANGVVLAAHSRDLGKSFSAPAVIARHGERLDIGPDAVPQIVIDASGRIVVAYSVFRDDHWNAQVLVSISHDGGKRFSAPRAIGPNPASQRFPALAFAPDGALFAAWIDKHLVAEAAKRGRKPKGASIAYAWSDDGGATFTAPAIAHAESCECCRIGAAVPAKDRPVIAFRGVFGQQVRDHALVAFNARNAPGASRRIAADNWVTDACPHHGPSLAVDGRGTMHVAWYTQGRTRSGTFYARSMDGGKSFSTPMVVGRDEQRSGRPYLLAAATTVWMAWKEFDGETSTVHGRVSQDGGETWGATAELARTRGYSHHPMLTRRDGRTYLSWLAHDEGYRLVPLR